MSNTEKHIPESTQGGTEQRLEKYLGQASCEQQIPVSDFSYLQRQSVNPELRITILMESITVSKTVRMVYVFVPQGYSELPERTSEILLSG